MRVMGAASANEEARVREATWTLLLGASFEGDTASFHRVPPRP
ncbi:hypothetical protein ACN28S_11405 [Cystobacter fuscus]